MIKAIVVNKIPWSPFPSAPKYRDKITARIKPDMDASVLVKKV